MIVTKSLALQKLNDHEAVALPTETVYGLAGRIDSEKALKLIFKTKKRPFFDPLIIHVHSLEMAKKYCLNWPEVYTHLAKKFWPGPLTFILKKNNLISPLITSGLETVAIRLPQSPIMCEIIKELNCPLAAPSANIFKKTSPTLASHVLDEFNNSVSVVDGGKCLVGIESTIIDIQDQDINILRPGSINLEKLQEQLNTYSQKKYNVQYKESTVAPGQLNEHYRPSVPIHTYIQNEKYLERKYKNNEMWIVKDNATITARELYQKFRQADQKEISQFVVVIKNVDPSWDGVLDRLKKASSEFYFKK